MLEPIAILHVFYETLGEITYPLYSHWTAQCANEVHQILGTSRYIEWLDTTNGRTTTTSSEVPR